MADLPGGHVYFHSPCFDGIASAVLVTDWMETTQRWSGSSLRVVNYHLRDDWLRRTLERPCAVLDFLFHPEADFWADHHLTTFVGESRPPEGAESTFVYDPTAGSCAGLLWRHLSRTFAYRNGQLADLVRWAEKIDAARYESIDEVFNSDAPALRINAALAGGDADEFSRRLVRLLRTRTPGEVAGLPDVSERYERVKKLADLGLERFRRAARLENGIVVFDVDAQETPVSRYAPYHFFRDARYSAGIVRTRDAVKITVMRNPWLEFKSVPLGKICERYGGGGHERVGAILLAGDHAAEAQTVLAKVLADIHRHEGARR